MTQKKPKIDYPCKWEYKIIGLSEVAVKDAVVTTLTQRDYKLNFSHKSRTGKYHSYSLETQVSSEEDRNIIFNGLSKSKNIQTVI